MTTTELATYAGSSLGARARYAETLSAASDLIPRGLFDKQTGRPSPAKILLVMETGNMLGLHPMAALQGIDVIEGKAAISPRLATGLLRAAGHKLRFTDSGSIEGGDYVSTVTLIRSDDPDEPITATFTPQMAARAGLCTYSQHSDGTWRVVAQAEKTGKPLPWMQYPEDMCQWRALSRVMRRGGEDVLLGIGYFPAELTDTLSDDGTRSGIDAGEQALLERLRSIDDKAHMATLYREHHKDDAWTARFDDEFSAHLATLTKDSRAPQPGAPGQTGSPDFDQEAAEQPQAPAERHESAPDAQTPVAGNSEPAEANVLDAEVIEDDGDGFDEPMPPAEAGADAYTAWLDRRDAWEAEREQAREDAAAQR